MNNQTKLAYFCVMSFLAMTKYTDKGQRSNFVASLASVTHLATSGTNKTVAEKYVRVVDKVS